MRRVASDVKRRAQRGSQESKKSSSYLTLTMYVSGRTVVSSCQETENAISSVALGESLTQKAVRVQSSRVSSACVHRITNPLRPKELKRARYSHSKPLVNFQISGTGFQEK